MLSWLPLLVWLVACLVAPGIAVPLEVPSPHALSNSTSMATSDGVMYKHIRSPKKLNSIQIIFRKYAPREYYYVFYEGPSGIAVECCSLATDRKDFRFIKSMGPYYYKHDEPLNKPPFPPEMTFAIDLPGKYVGCQYTSTGGDPGLLDCGPGRDVLHFAQDPQYSDPVAECKWRMKAWEHRGFFCDT